MSVLEFDVELPGHLYQAERDMVTDASHLCVKRQGQAIAFAPKQVGSGALPVLLGETAVRTLRNLLDGFLADLEQARDGGAR